MQGWITRPAFSAFGPDALHSPRQSPAFHQVHGSSPGMLRRQLRRLCSQRPGVYGMIDENEELLYVGKAKRLRTRLSCYFRRRGRDPKAKRIIARTRRIVWECATSEFAALLRELELITRWQPRLNVQGRPGMRRRSYVCVGRPPAPYVYLSRKPSRRALACFGPVLSGGPTREAVRRLNHWFQLRDCPQSQTMIFADQRALFPVPRSAGCLRYELGTCLGPCAGACTRNQYEAQVSAALRFLSGRDSSILEALQCDMTAASGALAFERAALLRDSLEHLRRLREQLDRLEYIQDRCHFVYPVRGQDGRERWYLIAHGRVKGMVTPPDDPESEKAVQARLQQVFETNRRSRRSPIPCEEIDAVLLVAAWFRRHPEELRRSAAKPRAASGPTAAPRIAAPGH